MSLIKLFLLFVKIGAILLGGGYVILPILQREFVEKRHLIEQDDLVNYFALSQSLPGIIAANMTMFIGYKLRGKPGAIVSMLGIIFMPFWCIIFLASLIGKFVNNSYVQGFLWGIGVAVIALVLLTIREILQHSNKNCFFYIILTFALFGLLFLKLSPIQIIIICSLFGVLIKYIQQKMETK